MSEQEFAGRTALVTGGSRGIGRAVSMRLAEAGAAVAVKYAGNDDAAEETRRLVEAFGQGKYTTKVWDEVWDWIG